MYANIPRIYHLPKVQQDKQLEEFLRGEICCQNFINQDLTFLQPSVIHTSQPKEDSILPERNTIAAPPIATQENNSPQEQDTNSPQVPPAEALYDRSRINNKLAKKLKEEEEPLQWSGIPFEKLLTDCYYTKVTQTFVKLIKRNTAGRQVVLVNTAQALKYLEAYEQRQSQLFTVLEKYHQVPDV